MRKSPVEGFTLRRERRRVGALVVTHRPLDGALSRWEGGAEGPFKGFPGDDVAEVAEHSHVLCVRPPLNPGGLGVSVSAETFQRPRSHPAPPVQNCRASEPSADAIPRPKPNALRAAVDARCAGSALQAAPGCRPIRSPLGAVSETCGAPADCSTPAPLLTVIDRSATHAFGGGAPGVVLEMVVIPWDIGQATRIAAASANCSSVATLARASADQCSAGMLFLCAQARTVLMLSRPSMDRIASAPVSLMMSR